MPSNFNVVPDVVTGQSFPPSLWESAIMNNLNLGVVRPLGDTTLLAPAATIAFASIPGTFASLLLIGTGRGDTSAANTTLNLRLNGDSAANYASQYIQGNAATASAVEAASASSIAIGAIAAATATASHVGSIAIVIPQYAGTTFFKQAFSFGTLTAALTTGNMYAMVRGGVWANTAAVTSITLLPAAGNFIAGTRFTLYGLPF
jgi:hypothetical protein